MSKLQLQKLFEHERDKELERLDDINTLARRNGRGGNIEEMELDLEAGWACQLLAKFGTRVDLSLENDCAGLTYLGMISSQNRFVRMTPEFAGNALALTSLASPNWPGSPVFCWTTVA